ncbi:MAG: GNAT family N-acetyltransferase [Flavobacterium sp.]|nr:GNAT family N-acetyltransferase [Flavobacterium sp.]
MKLTWKIKRFEELSAHELYNVLSLRNEVFVVEQNCVYQDADGKDKTALHVLGLNEGEIVAYARIFNRGEYFENASIGRVVVEPAFRGKNIGHELMKVAVKSVADLYSEQQITISAQSYLEGFYLQHGFVTQGKPYLEDGIPHVRMEKI